MSKQWECETSSEDAQGLCAAPPVTLGLSAGECTLGLGVGCLCGLRACECDKQSAYCFKESLPTYEKNFKQFFSARPRCGRRKLQC